MISQLGFCPLNIEWTRYQQVLIVYQIPSKSIENIMEIIGAELFALPHSCDLG